MTESSDMQSPSGFESVAFFAADHAVVENGKAYVNGGFWNKILQPSYPALISVSLVAVMRVPPEAHLANHGFAIEMEDERRKKLPSFKIEGEFRVGASPALEPHEPSVIPFAIPLNALNIERTGDYWFVLSVDGGEIDRFRIRAVQVCVVASSSSGVSGASGDATQAK